MFAGKFILVIGGTGSFGKKFIETILRKYPDVKRLIVFSRDELKQYEMSHVYPESKYPQMRYFIGDIRDNNRLYRYPVKPKFVIEDCLQLVEEHSEWPKVNDCVEQKEYGY